MIHKRKGYNSAVNAPAPFQPFADNEHQANKRQHRHSIYAADATNLLFMGVLLPIFTLIRYRRDIPWGAR
jgi:hypothetical protein